MIFSGHTLQFVKQLSSAICLATLIVADLTAQTVGAPEVVVLNATQKNKLRQTDRLVDQLVRTGQLRLNKIVPDTLIPNRQHERFSQYHKGLKVYGADVTRQTETGLTVSIFGQFYPNIKRPRHHFL